MGGGAQVLLIDEGELDDVGHALDQLGARVVRVREADFDGAAAGPCQLLVTTARCALARASGPPVAPVRVAVASDDSRMLRGALRRAGFDYVVHRPVHPEALRLLLARLVYRGPEKRRAPRVAVGIPVTFRAGLRRRAATLVDLSPSGCRLLCERPPAAGQRITLQLPDASIAKPWSLRAVVVRCARARASAAAGGTGAEPWTVAVAFELSGREARDRLDGWVAENAGGPACWRGGRVPGLVLPGEETRDQRRAPRRAYSKRVIALAETGAKVLLARDLSLGGLRVEPMPGLAPGGRVRVALHGGTLAQPLVLEARVARRGAHGDLVLRFENLDPAAHERLAKLLSDQPEIEALGSGRGAAQRRVVTRILGVP